MNKRKFQIIFSMILFAALVGLQGCKTKRALIKKPIKEQGESFLLEKMASNELDFNWFSARCAVTVINDKKTKTDLRGQLRIQKDSVIWMTLSPALGIEIARLMITQDSIWFINRIDKNYFKGDYDFINSFFQTTVDFDILQALLLGNDMIQYEDDNFRAGIDAMDYRLSAARRAQKKRLLQDDESPNILVQNIWLNPDHYKIVKVNLKEFGEENKQLEVRYSRFGAVQDQLVPGKLDMILQADKKLQINLQYNGITINETLKFPFSIPSKYTKMR